MHDTVQLKQGKLERDLERNIERDLKRNSSVFDEDGKPGL